MDGFSPDDYHDSEAEVLLMHLQRYCICHNGFIDDQTTVLELAEDLAMSMNPTTNQADAYRRDIERAIP